LEGRKGFVLDTTFLKHTGGGGVRERERASERASERERERARERKLMVDIKTGMGCLTRARKRER
jgi:hypothetical protein